MPNGEIHLELLLGKQVLDSAGEPVGRIEEVTAEKEGGEWVIQDYLIGFPAVLERLSAWTVGLAILGALGARKIGGGHRVPWDKLDLSDFDRPRLRCTLEELKTLSQPAAKEE